MRTVRCDYVVAAAADFADELAGMDTHRRYYEPLAGCYGASDTAAGAGQLVFGNICAAILNQLHRLIGVDRSSLKNGNLRTIRSRFDKTDITRFFWFPS